MSYRIRRGDIIRYSNRNQRVESQTRTKVKLVPVRKNSRTGEWTPTSRSYWHFAEFVRSQAVFLEHPKR
jgi:hypothetical protein